MNDLRAIKPASSGSRHALRDADIRGWCPVCGQYTLVRSQRRPLNALAISFIALNGARPQVSKKHASVQQRCASTMASAQHFVDIVMVLGVEKMTDTSRCAGTTAALAAAAVTEYEVSQGISFVALNALLMQRPSSSSVGSMRTSRSFDHRTPTARTTHAMFQSPISAEAYARAPMIATPVGLLDLRRCAWNAAVVLALRRNSRAP